MRKVTVNRTYSNWVISGHEHLNITEIESSGTTLQELLKNATIYIQTWHGGEGPSWSISDLPETDYKTLKSELELALY